MDTIIPPPHPETQQRRTEIGAWLRERRKAMNLSQIEVAAALGLGYGSVIDMMEKGRVNIAPGHLVAYSRILGVEPAEYAKTMLRGYAPEYWDLLFGGEQ